MNTEKMSHVVSMTANVGVLIGLSLLVYELNQNNQHLQQQAEFVAFQMRVQTFQGLAGNAEIGRLVYSNLSDQPLTEVDKTRRLDWFSSLFATWQWEFERQRSGLIKQFDSLTHMAAVYRDYFQFSEAEHAWHKRKHYFAADFVEFMDTQVIGPG